MPLTTTPRRAGRRRVARRRDDRSRLATWRDVRDRLGRGRVGDARHAHRRGVLRHARAGAARRHDSRRGAHRVDAQPRRRRARSSPPRDLREMYERGRRHARPRGDHVLPGRATARRTATWRCACSGIPRVRVYLGSWKEWGDREDTPVEMPARPGWTPRLASSRPPSAPTGTTPCRHEHHRLHQHAPRPLRRRAEDVARHPVASARCPSTPATCAAAAEWAATELTRIGMQNVPARSTRRATRSSAPSGSAPRARRRCCSTGTTTCSRSIRSTCGTRRPSSRPCATASCSRAAPATTRARCSCTSRPSRRT